MFSSHTRTTRVRMHTHTHTHTHTQILEAYRSSVSALKSAREGLTLEGAEEVMGDLREALEENQEVSGVLSAGMQAVTVGIVVCAQWAVY